MDIVLTFAILTAPFAIAALLSWWSHRRHAARHYLTNMADHPDWYRIQHDAEAARTRFEKTPTWPASGALGERR
jgi:hypothetical protein